MDPWYLITSALISSFAILWSIPTVLGQLFGFKMFIIQNYNNIPKLTPFVKFATIWRFDEPHGFVLGRWFIGFRNPATGKDGVNFIYCYMRQSQYDSIFHPDAEARGITFWERTGSFGSFFYDQRKLPAPIMKPTKAQHEAIDFCYQRWLSNNRNTIALLYGTTGTGKSYVASLLADRLLNKFTKVHLVDTFNPTEPGDEWIRIYNWIKPTKLEPLIVVLEEVDVTITAIHTESVKLHKSYPILIKNKTDWNQFFDRFDRSIYENVIFLMTSNKPPSFFNELDPSYMRPGRVNEYFNIY